MKLIVTKETILEHLKRAFVLVMNLIDTLGPDST